MLGDFRDAWGQFPSYTLALGDVHVLLLGYPSTLVGSSPTIDQLGSYVSDMLRSYGEPYARIIPVGHSLGCLVIQRAILQELHDGRSQDSPVDRIDTVVLYGPPLLGHQLAAVARLIGGRAFSDLVRDLELSGTVTQQIQSDWNHDAYRPSLEPGKLAYQKRIRTHLVYGLSDEIVRWKNELKLYRDPAPVSVPGDHFSLKEPTSDEDLAFLILKRILMAGDSVARWSDNSLAGLDADKVRQSLQSLPTELPTSPLNRVAEDPAVQFASNQGAFGTPQSEWRGGTPIAPVRNSAEARGRTIRSVALVRMVAPEAAKTNLPYFPPRDATRRAMSHIVSSRFPLVITGGPGSGKSRMLSALFEAPAFVQVLPRDALISASLSIDPQLAQRQLLLVQEEVTRRGILLALEGRPAETTVVLDNVVQSTAMLVSEFVRAVTHRVIVASQCPVPGARSRVRIPVLELTAAADLFRWHAGRPEADDDLVHRICRRLRRNPQLITIAGSAVRNHARTIEDLAGRTKGAQDA
jgi:hypothetical protein